MHVNRYLTAIAVATSLAWTTSETTSHVRSADCRFVVYNRTPDILDVRRRMAPFRYKALGVLNPGESLPGSTACSDRRVFVAGAGIPAQVGQRIQVWQVYAEAELEPGRPVAVNLTWP